MKNNNLSLLKELTILLVEDDEILLKDLETTLGIFFKKVIMASNGIEAFEIYKNNCIDMVITDYVMPNMNGYDLCINIRKDNKRIPIVIMSNHSEKEKLIKSIPLNLTEYLIKPIDYTTLTTTLEKLSKRLDDESITAHFITPFIKYNQITKELTKDETIIHLTKTDIRTLDILLKLKNTLATNEVISHAIDNEDNKSNQAIKNIIYRLRQKLGKDTIINVQDFGYILKITE